MQKFLPTTKQEMKERGWDACDVIFITADAYCDHPSFGVAVLSRFLESHGYRVGVISQPDWKRDDDFMVLGRPRLFFGVTAGNLDSMLNIYTSNMNLRRQDKYSPGGAAGLRPKLPTIVYSNKIRQLFSGAPIVIGGIEASLRRLAHYDFWSDKVKRSILFDSKADILVYGMGERQVLEISDRLKTGEKIADLCDIRGTVVISRDVPFLKDFMLIPSFQEVSSDKKKFLEAFVLYEKELNPFNAKPIVQKTDTRFCVQLPPALPFSTQEIDRIYNLRFNRKCHPKYERFGGVPALATVQTSIVSHRGCAASCSFCSLSLHQGRVIQSRSGESILSEAKSIARDAGFKGVISDIGGPTANMYGAFCAIKNKCKKPDCLWPEVCKNFKLDFSKQIEMLDVVRGVKGIKKVSIQSGMRFDLLLLPQAQDYFHNLCCHHVSGQLKVAPEHTSEKVLKLMHKPSFKTYAKFVNAFEDENKKAGKKQYLVQYFITAHPGCNIEDAEALARYTKKMGYTPEQIQDFIPLPMTRSAAMYYTGTDPDSGAPVYVPKGRAERSRHRRLIQPSR